MMRTLWRNCKLGDIINLKRGYDLPHASRVSGPFPIVSSSGITGHHSDAKVKGPGVVTGRYGTLGEVFFIEKDFWPLNTSLYVQDFKGNDPHFISYFLRTLDFGTQNAAGAVPGVNRNHLHAMGVRVPAFPTQLQITGILSAYDQLIENSEQRIKILEEMAHLVYCEWFVNRCFPGHDNLSRIAPSLSEIPKGWEVKKLGEILNVDKGVSYNGAGLTDDGNPMVNLKNIQPGGRFRRDATKPYSGDFKPRHTVKPGEVVIANTDLTQAGNVVGTPVLIPHIGEGRPILISHHLFAARPFDGTSPLFLYHLMLHENFRGFAKGFAIGTTVLGLPKEGILNYSFACPPTSLINEFVKRIGPMHELIETLFDRVEKLRLTRDLLLPRLISGQIDLNQMEKRSES